MNPITSFDPVATPSGTIKTNGINKGEQIILFNISVASLILEFADHTKDRLPPGWARTWTKDSPMSNIKYTTEFTLNLPSQPVSVLYGTVYEPGEHTVETNSPIQYAFNVGNTVTQTLTNIGGALGSAVIQMEQSGAPNGQFNFNADNAGNLLIQWWQSVAPTAFVPLLQLIAGTSVTQGTTHLGGNTSGGISQVQVDGPMIIGSGTQLLNSTFWGDVIINPQNHSVIGASSGSIDVIAPIQGGLLTSLGVNLYVLRGNNYVNNSGSRQNVTLPTAFKKHQFFYVGGIAGSVHLVSGGVDQTVGIVNSLSGAGGTVALQSNIPQYCFGDNGTAIDTISFDSINVSHNFIILLLGI